MQVTYEDTAPPFNPYARLPVTPPDTTIEMRKIGGLGVLLTKELAATRDYSLRLRSQSHAAHAEPLGRAGARGRTRTGTALRRGF